ncbi:MAG: glycosyltransferase family 2 protein [Patescibacteria group bacterium]
MESIELSIAVNTYKSPELLRLCLESIERFMPGSGIRYEVMVVDSATEEDMEMMMREDFPHVRFLPFRENVGFKSLINTSLDEAKGEYVFLINGDIILTEGAVPELLAYLREHQDIGILGPKQFNFNGSIQQSFFRFYKPTTILYRRTFLGRFAFAKRHLDWFGMKEIGDPKEPIPAEWVIGSALLVRRKVALEVGYMDNRFFMYMEDVDWCRRFWEKGLRVVYYPKCFVYHYHGKGSAQGGFFKSLLSNKLTWYHIESAMKYFWKYRGQKSPTIF